ncbi:Phosphatidylinositol 4-phosphate 5-kinase [Actinidia chinensis var. chinensis]|uniref:Phosphatidylinositol 4-phosphate 5-kinase n=1 Tax=Actinidia chinensis var. chinensis TaxID=1590841 RepID=A0A2R6RGK4_ACTCC|nr:Phosphatidylinositol 4-phosphate 5-kinase [Actinidia chinensis var. chinensis]
METSERFSEKVFLNGDTYVGNFKGIFSHGKGKYTWVDGTVYEGNWEEGKMTGKGQMFWPSGATYEGDFSGGYLHGFGTFTRPDGSNYRGAWRMNVQHGLGRKEYCYSDVYDGLWKEGVHEGHGRYAWSNGNTYIGNWKDGKTWGRGVMKWVNGDLFDGFWLNGFRHGSGCCRFADGSYYFGTWTKGLKDGQGTYYPAGSKHPSLRMLCSCDKHEGMRKGLLSHSSSLNSVECRVQSPSVKRSLSEKISINGLLRGSSLRSHRTTSLDEGWSLGDSTREFSSCDLPCMLTHSSDGGQHEVEDNASVVFEREYMQGVLIKEWIRKSTGLSYKSKHRRKFYTKEMKKRSFVDIFEGHRSCYLMLNLQLGIRYTVGKITPVPMREVRASDFGERARIRMNLREMFKLDAAAYMMSICGDDGLRELSSPGKSGSIFYISHDDRFFIKTLRRSELKILLKMLPRYYDHVKEHENTLITKFFGLHRITLTGGRKVRFVVMGNMFCTELCIHRRFDLKGSTHGRITNQDLIDESTTLKDLDLQYEFHMDKLVRESLFKQLNLDSTFLESQQIIDYSLLMGLHFRAPEQLKALLEPPDALHKHENLHQTDGAISQEFQIPPKGLLLVTHEPSSVITTPVPHSRGNTLRAFSVGDKEVDLLLPGTARLRVQLGVNMPAQARRKLLPQEETDSVEAELYEVYDVVLYLGTIDILQNYSMKKKIEHAYKSLQHGPMSISSVEPKLYSNRFIDFLEKIFPCAQQP